MNCPICKATATAVGTNGSGGEIFVAENILPEMQKRLGALDVVVIGQKYIWKDKHWSAPTVGACDGLVQDMYQCDVDMDHRFYIATANY